MVRRKGTRKREKNITKMRNVDTRKGRNKNQK
jgi:hypothetical protein